MSESPRPRRQGFQEKCLCYLSLVQVQQREVDAEHYIPKGVVWSNRIVQWVERTRQASICHESGQIQPDFSALSQARDCRAETFPHNQLNARAKCEVKQLAWCLLVG